MEQSQVDQILMANGSKLPVECINMLREKLLACEDQSYAYMLMSQLKDPTISLVLSIVVGGWGIDRFYIGDVGMGIGKLLTGGGCGIWWLIDLFLIMDATRKKNLEALMMQLH